MINDESPSKNGGKSLRVAILCTEKKPVPAAQGGAVETLVDLLIQNNEDHKQIELDVYSIYNREACVLSKNYPNTRFYSIDRHSVLNPLFSLSNRLFHKCRIRTHRNIFLERAAKELEKHVYDWVIIENRPYFVDTVKKHIPKSTHIALHLHNDVLGREHYYARHVIAACDRILSVSQYIHGRVIEAAANRKDRMKSTVLYNRIDVHKFSKRNRPVSLLRERFRIPAGRTVIFYYGRVRQEKGVLELVHAFRKALEKDPALHLVIVGEVIGDDFQIQLNAAIKALPAGHVSLMNYVDHAQIPDYLAGADIVALPSLWQEAFGLTIAESMAMGKAIISTNIGAIPELLDGNCGLLVDNDGDLIDHLAEAIVKLAADPQLGKRLSANARKKALTLFRSESYLSDLIERLKGPAADKEKEASPLKFMRKDTPAAIR
ncbi:glycosyltransferase family 1 protein [Sporolactobacillus sp. THM7-4]|nr:glycosyltransferase family 1 protein [Sporolactobacillus sp. THM7-4]